jgi:hypothetical protein
LTFYLSTLEFKKNATVGLNPSGGLGVGVREKYIKRRVHYNERGHGKIPIL